MIAWVFALAAGVTGTELLHFLAHHRTELAAVLAAMTGWVVHRARRRVCHTGARVEGMPLLEPVAVRRPDLAPKPKPALEAAAC